MIGRRDLLRTAGAVLLAGCARAPERPPVQGRILGAAVTAGHRLMQPDFPAVSRRERCDVAVLGSGIAGLCAARRLRKAGIEDLRVLELEPQPGGNSRFAEYPESRAPWAAHYLPLPTREATETLELLDDFGLVVGWAPNGDPIYDERHLCHAPEERLFQYGQWEEGLYPRIGATEEDLRQLREFYDEVDRWQERKAFTIPVHRSPDTARELDGQSMDEFMARRGWTSERLRWHVEYGCRDDYGTTLATTSAWVGLHYFASRSPDRAGPEGAVFTWPEGNGWFVQRLAEPLGERLVLGALVFRVANVRGGVEVDYLDVSGGRTVRLQCRRAVFAMPTFVRPWLIEGSPAFPEFTYAPWTVANLVVDRLPAESPRDFPLCWDNVLYGSGSLGYVVATHQSLSRTPGPSVLTWYRPWTGDPVAERRKVLQITWEGWRDEVLADLTRAHPDLPSLLRRLDVMVLGHAMVRPVPGLMWGPARARAARPQGGIHFAHSDLSGLSLFEEAQHHGLRAADEVLTGLRVKS